MSTSGFIGTIITFDTTATWAIEKVNSSSALLQVEKANDTLPSTLIKDNMMMEFEKDIPYEFLARNNNHPTPRSLVVIFRKAGSP